MTNATGAGDSMMAAIAWAFLGGEDLEGQGLAGLATSSICVESPATINTNICADAVRKRMAQADAATTLPSPATPMAAAAS